MRSVQEALDRAGPGDIVRLDPGVYHERVAFSKGRSYGKPITLEGEPGAILDGSEIGELDWQLAPDVAQGVWLGAGADRCTVRFNEMFMAPYAGADPKGLGQLAGP